MNGYLHRSQRINDLQLTDFAMIYFYGRLAARRIEPRIHRDRSNWFSCHPSLHISHALIVLVSETRRERVGRMCGEDLV
jgi:hypothetical protein